VNDIIAENGVLLEKLNLVRRLQIIYTILDTKYHEDDLNCCKVFVKRYFRTPQLDEMINIFMPTLPYSCRGVYFKPFYLKFKDILYNFDDALIKKVTRVKLKHTHESTFLLAHQDVANSGSDMVKREPDVGMTTCVAMPTMISTPSADLPEGKRIMYAKKTNTPDIYELYDSSSVNIPPCIALVNNITTSKLLREAFRLHNANDRVPFIVEYNQRFNKWSPVELAPMPS
jgi:hypothetical protein